MSQGVHLADILPTLQKKHTTYGLKIVGHCNTPIYMYMYTYIYAVCTIVCMHVQYMYNVHCMYIQYITCTCIGHVCIIMYMYMSLYEDYCITIWGGNYSDAERHHRCTCVQCVFIHVRTCTCTIYTHIHVCTYIHHTISVMVSYALSVYISCFQPGNHMQSDGPTTWLITNQFPGMVLYGTQSIMSGNDCVCLKIMSSISICNLFTCNHSK